MHPAGCQFHADARPECHFQCRRQCLAPFAVQYPHTPDMPGKMAFVHELGGDLLLQCRLPHGQQAGRTRERDRQFRRHHQIAKPQRRKQHLTERPGVQHALPAIEAFQRRQRAAHVAELAVVIVLQDPRAHVASPGQKLHPARQGQRHAGWALMGRCHHRQPGLWRGRHSGRNPQTLAIHPDRHDAHARRLQRLTGHVIARVFHPHRVAGPQQDMPHQRQGALISGRDQHLPGGAADTAGDAQIGGNRLAQGRHAGRIAPRQIRCLRGSGRLHR